MLFCWVLGLWIWRFNALLSSRRAGAAPGPASYAGMLIYLALATVVSKNGLEAQKGDAEILVKSNWIFHLNFVVCQGWRVWYILSWGLTLFNEWGDRGQASSWVWIPSDQRCKLRKLRMVIFRIPESPIKPRYGCQCGLSNLTIEECRSAWWARSLICSGSRVLGRSHVQDGDVCCLLVKMHLAGFAL